MSLCVGLSVCAQVPSEARGRYQIPWILTYRWLEPPNRGARN